MYLYEELERIKSQSQGEGNGREPWADQLHGQGGTFEGKIEYQSLPEYVSENLNPSFELRPYQVDAFRNFITYYEMEKGKGEPLSALFHMATGSGKTLIMAGLMLYLYQQGYRCFLFFVNLGNILQKTKTNFLDRSSGKYLFAPKLFIEGEEIRIREVQNFQTVDEKAMNICFTTTQGLHSDMRVLKENHMSLGDFEGQRVVLISDEAHHLNVSTKRMSKEEENSYRSWENTVKSLFLSCKGNLLLEFTATCDLQNPLIKAAYERKIVYDYPLKKFRQDLYSKEIVTLRSDLELMDRVLLALVLSQYRLKIFQRNKIVMKPVVLFKAAKIADSRSFMRDFEEKIRTLEGWELRRLSLLAENPAMKKAFSFFEREKITMEMLAQELRVDFSVEHCVSVNEESDLEEKQLLLNSLEEEGNPYRAIFEVRKLDEGWDVLNLFDIVRLYETRQGGGKRISTATISEAQLIGRGARYCPFVAVPFQNRYQRKYDHDLSNELRICEELYYHCQNDSRYISELHQALREIGIETRTSLSRENHLKPSFLQTSLYQEGLVVVNERRKREPSQEELLSQLRGVHRFSISTGLWGEDVVMEPSQEEQKGQERSGKDTGQEKEKEREKGKEKEKERESFPEKKVYSREFTLGEIARINYSIPYKLLSRYPALGFSALKKRFPKLSSLREFLTEDRYLGGARLVIESQYEEVPVWVLSQALERVFKSYQGILSSSRVLYEGSRELFLRPLREVFTDKVCSYPANALEGGEGFGQRETCVPEGLRLDLMEEAWYPYQENFGSLQEKAFVVYFKSWYEALKKDYSEVYLIRNEGQLPLFSLLEGNKLTPAFVIILQGLREGRKEHLQVVVEPLQEPFSAEEEPDFVLSREPDEITKSASEPSRQVESEFLEEGSRELIRELERASREAAWEEGERNEASMEDGGNSRPNMGENRIKLLTLRYFDSRVRVTPFFVENAHLKSP